MKFYIINGPNINLLGTREPSIYGCTTYADLCKYVGEKAKELGHDTVFYQSNHEGDIVDAIQGALGVYDAIVINPAAYTHTSIAILDALKAVALPCAEVHISDVTKREDYRQISYAGEACCCHFIGQGIAGYVNAIKELAEKAAK